MPKTSKVSTDDEDLLEVSAQLKASFKKNPDGTESLELTGRSPADVSIIKEGGKRESRQGDHTITHALPKHGILKEFRSLDLDIIDDLSAHLREKKKNVIRFY